MENFSPLARINISVIKRYKEKGNESKVQSALKRVDIFYAAEKLTDEEYQYIQNFANEKKVA